MLNVKFEMLAPVLITFLSSMAFANRVVYSAIVASNYNYVVIYNPSSSIQTVTVEFVSQGITIQPGGFRSSNDGVTRVVGGVASQGVTCPTQYLCSISDTLNTTDHRFLRAGVGIIPPQGYPANGWQQLLTTANNVGLGVTITVNEDAGFLIGNGVSYLDIDYGAAAFVDAPFTFLINAGRPF